MPENPVPQRAAAPTAYARRLATRRTLVVGLLSAAAAALTAAPAVADSCPNAVYRTGAGALLPDCRAYEQVSPEDKGGNDVGDGDQAVASDGNAIAYGSFGAFNGSSANTVLNQYVASRGSTGWTSQAITLPSAPDPGGDTSEIYDEFSPDLSTAVVEHENPPFDGASTDTFNLYRRNPDGSLQLVTLGETPQQVSPPIFAGASANLTDVAFDDFDGAIDPAAYEWVNGTLQLVSVLPNGSGTPGEVGNGLFSTTAVSIDGSRVYWFTTGSGDLYLYDGGASVPVSFSQCTQKPSCATGESPGTFWYANTDGSLALFTSQDQLTNNSTAQVGGQGPDGDLYEYNAATGGVTDLTVDGTDPYGADLAGVVAASSDLSYIYFVAYGDLAGGATFGDPNLYVEHDGGPPVFIATLNGNDSEDWDSNPRAQSYYAQLSADGAHLLFSTTNSQPNGYPNQGENEIYLYSAPTNTTQCLSCDPSGASAVSNADLAPRTLFEGSGTASVNIDSDGTRAFFESADPLLAQDTNGVENVYEWEAAGTGSCQTSGGCLYSISSGSSTSPSYFESSSPTGDDVFFLTREGLVPGDTDALVDLYDARVDGGFPSTPPATSTPCAPGDCQGPASAQPPPPTVATVIFYGPGNPGAGPTVRVRMLTRTVHGDAFVVRVQVPRAGTVTISGSSIRAVRRRFRRGGTFGMELRLTKRAAAALQRTHRLTGVRLRIGYTPASGRGAARTIRLTVEQRGAR